MVEFARKKEALDKSARPGPGGLDRPAIRWRNGHAEIARASRLVIQDKAALFANDANVVRLDCEPRAVPSDALIDTRHKVRDMNRMALRSAGIGRDRLGPRPADLVSAAAQARATRIKHPSH